MKPISNVVGVVALSWLVFSCGAGPAADQALDPSCSGETLEADFTVAGPMSGPKVLTDGSLAKAPAERPYVVATTYLRMQPSKESQAHFQQLMRPISVVLPNQDGLEAEQVAYSSHCLTARTLSVWRDQAAMMKFVTGPEHMAAVASVSEVSRGGSITTTWSSDGADASWSAAAEHLKGHTGPTY